MRKVVDVRHEYRGYHSDGGVCRLRIYRDEDELTPPVVICTELPENKNTSVTNMAEYLAAEVLERYLPDQLGQPNPFIWIEHYPAERRPYRYGASYDYVRFASQTPQKRLEGGVWRRRLGRPTWFHAPVAEVQALLGEPLERSVAV